jgi:hypothetical protein
MPRLKIVVLLACGVLLMGCALLQGTVSPPPAAATLTGDEALTIVAQAAVTNSRATLQGMQTQAAATATVTPTVGEMTATAVVRTLLPSATPIPTETPVTPDAPVPSVTLDPAQAGCDQLSMMVDMTYPDGAQVGMGTGFTKTWRVKNTGTCTWLSDYQLVFHAGEQMGGPESQRLGTNVLPGEMVDISVGLRAPETSGHFVGYWMLRNASGWAFGQGDQQIPLDVDIYATGTSPYRYDFAGFFCQAYWKGGSTVLKCNGKEGDPLGWVKVYNEPELEDGTVLANYGLITNPPAKPEGIIRGIFTPFTVRNGDRFQAILSCEYEYRACDVTYMLEYQIDDGPIRHYATWVKKYDEHPTTVDISMYDLMGETVRFVLTVRSNGGSEDNRAIWIRPRIASGPKEATPTPSPTP